MKKKLKIAMFCTNEWPTPPPENTFYAPLWITYEICEGMTKKGHQVYYFGAKDSKISGKLISGDLISLKKNKEMRPYLSTINEKVVSFYEQLLVSKIYQLNQTEKFDIIHIHPYRRGVVFAPLTKTPTIFTLHDPIEEFNKYMIEATINQPHTYLVSISNAQRRPAPNLNYIGTVYNGLKLEKYKFEPKPKNYLVVAGRFVPEKGIDIALKIAKTANISLKIAGGEATGGYFKEKIKPYLSKKIKYIGMIDFYKMGNFYRKGKALLYPLRWQEPFGLVVIEAMACGTPVIAFDRGSMRELIKDGETGFIVKTIPEMVRAIKKISLIDRRKCRAWVEKKFTVEKMVEDYEKVYYKILEKEKKKTK